MKISKIADKIVGYAVKSLINNGKQTISLNEIITLFPQETENSVILAIKMLGTDGLANVAYFSNKPSHLAISLKAIRNIEEDTFLKKGYNFFKEIRQWL